MLIEGITPTSGEMLGRRGSLAFTSLKQAGGFQTTTPPQTCSREKEWYNTKLKKNNKDKIQWSGI